jgi:hypothetical protein
VPNATFETVKVADEPVFVMDVTPVDPSMLNVDAAVAVIVYTSTESEFGVAF